MRDKLDIGSPEWASGLCAVQGTFFMRGTSRLAERLKTMALELLAKAGDINELASERYQERNWFVLS
jgi:hypothetical protein